MSALFAFLHHLAAFALVAALAVEWTLVSGDAIAPDTMRRLARVDAAYGAAAGLLLLIGLARVMWFEKGADYYVHSAPFIAKLSLFAVVGLLSIRPTLTFASWRRALRQGATPGAPAGTPRTLRALVGLQLACIVPILLCAALMARGVGYFGS